jgi:hypothetical protein
MSPSPEGSRHKLCRRRAQGQWRLLGASLAEHLNTCSPGETAQGAERSRPVPRRCSHRRSSPMLPHPCHFSSFLCSPSKSQVTDNLLLPPREAVMGMNSGHSVRAAQRRFWKTLPTLQLVTARHEFYLGQTPHTQSLCTYSRRRAPGDKAGSV